MATSTANLLAQRSYGALTLTVGKTGPQVLREVGASKLRLPQGSTQAIIINTGGGLAGGDTFENGFTCHAEASLTLTSQAAERVYRTLGPPAQLATRIAIEPAGQVFWLPQETIVFDGASLARTYHVTLAQNSKFLAIEPLVFGRTEMGEKLASIQIKDSWRIWREGRLLHAEEFALGPNLPATKATLAGATAMATMIYVAPDAENRLEALRPFCACSAWNGKLIARFTASDGYLLRKALIPAINKLAGAEALPKIWTA